MTRWAAYTTKQVNTGATNQPNGRKTAKMTVRTHRGMIQITGMTARESQGEMPERWRVTTGG